jgi:hypothetical protein
MIPPPKRWLDSELPEELSSALASAEADASDLAIDRVRARLGAALGPAFGVEAQVPEASSAVRASKTLLRGKGLGLGAILSIGIAFLWIARPEADAGAVTSRHQSPSTKVAELAPSQPVVVVEPVAPLPAAEEEPQPAAAVPARSVVKRAAPEPGLAEELRALAQIKQDVSAAPRRALSEADAHARRFPHGTLGPERQLLRIEALLRLGREAEANKLAQRELAAPGGHPYRVRIEQLLTQAR